MFLAAFVITAGEDRGVGEVGDDAAGAGGQGHHDYYDCDDQELIAGGDDHSDYLSIAGEVVDLFLSSLVPVSLSMFMTNSTSMSTISINISTPGCETGSVGLSWPWRPPQCSSRHHIHR